jgi:sorbitol-specific phosphotransferase system component IIBC
MCSLPRKAALESEAAVVSMMTAHVSCGRLPQAFLKILVPERQGWADSGVSRVARGQGHIIRAGYLTGAIDVDSVLKVNILPRMSFPRIDF